MAIKLKKDKTFTTDTEVQMGAHVINENLYGVIDNPMYDKGTRTCFFSVDVYGSKELRADGLILHRFNYTFYGDDFSAKIGNNGLTIQNAYIIALTELIDWQSDE